MSLSALCITAAAVGLHLSLPLQQFTLAWTHSIEKTRWEEDYRIVGAHLQLVEARIRGSGAGMEPPEGAVLKKGVWHYRPTLPPLPQLDLVRSPYVPDYQLCHDGHCRSFASMAGPADRYMNVVVKACPAQ
jgi:hypothetical protein